MGVYVRRPWGVCQRTERKVPLKDLIEDGELPGLLVDRNDADKPHPQRRLVEFPPDLPPRRPSPPLDAEHATIYIGRNGDPSTGQPILNPFASAVLTNVTVEISSNVLINTANKRASVIHIGQPWRGKLPLPDGTIDQGDRQQVAFLYSGIEA